MRWVAVTNKAEQGLLFIGDPTICFGAKHYAQSVIDQAKYSFQMKRSDTVHLNVDLGQAGVGGNNSWGATPMEAYQLKNQAMSYKFRMVPIQSTREIEDKLMKRPASF